MMNELKEGAEDLVVKLSDEKGRKVNCKEDVRNLQKYINRLCQWRLKEQTNTFSILAGKKKAYSQMVIDY